MEDGVGETRRPRRRRGTAPPAANARGDEPQGDEPQGDEPRRADAPAHPVHPGRPARTPASAAAIVAALWRTMPPAVWGGGPGAHGTLTAATAARAALPRLARQADRLALRAPGAERAAAALLAETARAVDGALRDASQVGDAPVAPAVVPAAGGAGACLASPVRLRLARMERWLAARAAVDPRAEAAADLCLWVLEQLECEAAPPRPGAGGPAPPLPPPPPPPRPGAGAP